MDFMYAAEAQAYQGFFEGNEAFLRKYLVLLYTGFYIFGVGEVVPRSNSFEVLEQTFNESILLTNKILYKLGHYLLIE